MMKRKKIKINTEKNEGRKDENIKQIKHKIEDKECLEMNEIIQERRKKS